MNTPNPGEVPNSRADAYAALLHLVEEAKTQQRISEALGGEILKLCEAKPPQEKAPPKENGKTVATIQAVCGDVVESQENGVLIPRIQLPTRESIQRAFHSLNQQLKPVLGEILPIPTFSEVQYRVGNAPVEQSRLKSNQRIHVYPHRGKGNLYSQLS